MSFRSKVKALVFSNYKVKCLVTKTTNCFSDNDKIDKKHIDPTVIFKKLRVINKGHNNKIIIAPNCRLINCSITIYGSDNTITIGENCNINNMHIWFEDDHNSISLGRNTSINGETNFACIEGTNIEIGEDCMFSSYIHFRTGDSHSVVDDNNNRINHSKNIYIGNHVWVGQNVFVGKGSRVSSNSIVGACAVVTKQFDLSNVAIAGNPAKIIKNDINWKRERV